MAHASANTNDSPQSSRPLDLTFGVELKFILAIHNPPSPPPSPSPTNPFPTHHLPQSTLDPISYLHEQFTHSNLPSTTSKFPKGIQHAYKTWLITTDGSLIIPSFEETAAALPGLVDAESAAARVEWDVHGIELVSPPLRVPDVSAEGPAYLQDPERGVGSIRAYLDGLHKHTANPAASHTHTNNYTDIHAHTRAQTYSHQYQRHAAFPNPSCGMHIHIGLAPNTSSNTSAPTPIAPSNAPLPLPVLRHLSYLLLRNEHLLSSLHHPSRTPYPGTQAYPYAKSNRVSFRADGHGACMRERVDWGEVWARVFEEEEEGKWGMSLEKLCWIMGADEVLDREGRTEWMREEERREEEERQQEQEQGSGEAQSGEVGAGGSNTPSAAEGGSVNVRASNWNGGADDYPWGPVDWNGPVAGEPTTSGIDAIGATHTHTKNDSSSYNTDSWTPISTSSTPSSPPSSPSPTPTSTDPCPAPPSDPLTTDPFQTYNSPAPFPPGTKHKLTNYTLLPRLPSEGPRTIEFRQPAGTLSLHEISETVRLYVALVREAERRANEDAVCGRRVGSGVRVGPAGGLEEFLEGLALPRGVREYWIRRAGEMEREAGEMGREAGEMGREEGMLGDCERCGLCWEEFERRRQEEEKGLEWEGMAGGS